MEQPRQAAGHLLEQKIKSFLLVLVISLSINMVDIDSGVCTGILTVFINSSIEPARQSSLGINRQPPGLCIIKG